MSTIHSIRLDVREPTFVQLRRIKARLGAASDAEVFRRALDELDRSLRVNDGQIPVLESAAAVAR